MKNLNKRDDILQAALELIAEHGFHEAPMSLIAAKAGVGSGTIYIYFKSKDDLINEVNRMLEKKVLTVVEKDYSSGKDTRERFFHLCKTVVTYFINNPVHFRFMEQYFNSPYGESFQRERIFGKNEEFDIFRNLIEQGIKEKMIKDLPVFMHFALAFGPVIILVRDHIFGLVNLDDVLINQAIEAFWDAIKRQSSD
ncbi:MAG: TetR/AcrR family transcriptional regulator [Smithella sp.]|jgi:AcrR family transcriptional regulator